ncbi:MAG: metallophosphoesterase [Candidatus Wenzhouxiangella sp. M2_3B_020]
MTATRVLQVSDCHLARETGRDYRGQDPDRNLDALSGAVRRWAPDLLVLTGDLSEDGSEPAYERIRDWALQFGVAVAWIPGNHDERAVMSPVFDAAGLLSGPVVEAGDWQLALLDSTWPDDPAGELDETRLEPLEALDPSRPCGVFVHHQPVPVEAAWIDKVGMREAERLWMALERSGAVRFIAFGHVHQRFRADRAGMAALACPSTAANTIPATLKFAGNETTPLARWFVLGQNDFRTGYLAP